MYLIKCDGDRHYIPEQFYISVCVYEELKSNRYEVSLNEVLIYDMCTSDSGSHGREELAPNIEYKSHKSKSDKTSDDSFVRESRNKRR